MRTRKIRLARTAQAALFREVKSAKGLCPLISRQRPWLLDSVFWRASRAVSRVCPSSQRVSIIRAVPFVPSMTRLLA
jgi:hypothetical protein